MPCWLAADGAIHTAKVPSMPADQARGVLEAIGAVLARAGAQPGKVERFAHGMTVATNALLEGRGARTALIATEGFGDVVELGRQARPHLYRLCEASRAPLVAPELRLEAPERMTPEGPLRALSREAAGALVARLARERRPEAVAVALLHSYAHPEHEQLLGELLAERLPGVHVSLSHELVGTFREYERSASTEVDAALSPLLGTYLRRLCVEADAIGLARPAVMQSSGGLIDAEGAAAHAALTVLSGPAGGVRGAQLLAELAGRARRVVLRHGRYLMRRLPDPTAERSRRPRLVSSRGGRWRWRCSTSTRSAPAAARSRGGMWAARCAWGRARRALTRGRRATGAAETHPTVTDANLLLGRLPGGTGDLAGGLALDREAAERAVARLAAELDLTVTRCAEGIVRVAEAEMLGALRLMSVERGLDPRDLALLAFGGAGPLHAAALARELGMRRILCPRASGVLCAFGLAAAAPRRDAARTVMLAGESLCAERLARARAALLARACADLGETPARIAVSYELRYRGQSFELAVAEDEREPPDPDALRESFARAHERRYGYRDATAEVELVTIRACAWGAAPDWSRSGRPANGSRVAAGSAEPPAATVGRTGRSTAAEPPRRERCRVVLDGRELDAECLRGELPPGTRVRGPAICALGESTLLVPAGWEGEVDELGTVRLRDTEGAR